MELVFKIWGLVSWLGHDGSRTYEEIMIIKDNIFLDCQNIITTILKNQGFPGCISLFRFHELNLGNQTDI